LDIYQIIITYNKAWTKEETVCFGIILIFISGILAISVYKHKILKQQAVAILLLAIYLGIVLGSTVFTRESSICSYKLMPLWSWKEILFGNDARELLIENLLNVILLLPMGALLPFVFGKKLKIKKAFLYGFFVSVVIECCQLVFKCGLFEWDDMIHNGIGCMLGDMIGNTILNEWQRLKGNRNI
jgi:glycopeptide antibiotics resistance protein